VWSVPKAIPVLDTFLISQLTLATTYKQPKPKVHVTTASGNRYTVTDRVKLIKLRCSGYQMLSLQLFVLLMMGDSDARNM